MAVNVDHSGQQEIVLKTSLRDKNLPVAGAKQLSP